MLTDKLSPGIKVELRAVGRGFMDDDSRTKRIYVSKVTDLVSEEKMEIQMPTEQGKLVLLPVNGEYSLCFYSSKGLYQCYARISDRYKNGNMYYLMLEVTTALKKLQRREYYRFSCSLELKSRLLTPEELEAVAAKESIIFQEQPMQKSVIVDISGGGLRFISNCRYDVDESIFCVFSLGGGARAHEYSMVSTVLMASELQDRPGLYEHRIQYSYINEASREEIIHFIFEEERKIRKKQN